jgi:clathrin heavy chain
MIDLQKNPPHVTHLRGEYQAAIMNPADNILAYLSAETIVWMVDPFDGSISKSCTMTEPVVFLKWTCPENLAIITATSVYHWSLPAVDPEKFIDLDDPLQTPTTIELDEALQTPTSKIINYNVSPDGLFCIVEGNWKDGAGAVKGHMMLCDVKKKTFHPISGQGAQFRKLHIAERPEPVQVIVYGVHQEDQDGKKQHLTIFENGCDPYSETAFYRVSDSFHFENSPDPATPASLVVAKDEIAYIFTNMGDVLMFDIQTADLYSAKVSTDSFFVTCTQESNGAIFGITDKGQGFKIGMNDPAVIPCIPTMARKTVLPMCTPE